MNEREDIKAYIDGELSPGRADEVRRAIESDPELMEEYTFMKGMSSQIVAAVRQPHVQGAEKVLKSARPRSFRFAGVLVGAGVVLIAWAILFPVFFQAKVAGRGGGARTNVAMTFGAEAAKEELAPASELLDSDAESKARPRSGDDSGVTMGALTDPRIERAKTLDESGELGTWAGGRKVIKDGSLALEVANVQAAVDETTMMVTGYKGYIESNAATTVEGTQKARADMTLRVPSEHFEDAVAKIKSLGDLVSETTGGDDVTARVADIEARIRTLKAEEETLRSILRQAKNVGEVIEVNDRISQVRQEIEGYDAQRLTMERLAELSTITVRYTEEVKVTDEPQPDDWFEDTKLAAIVMLKGIGRFVAQTATFLFILAPVWIPALLLVLWFRRRSLAPQP